jgi:hypothetical protein
MAFAPLACSSKKSGPSAPEPPVAPSPTSPQNLLALIAWCWEMQDETLYRGIFTSDFFFDFAPADSQSVGAGLDRAQEIDAGNNLFGSGLPPAHPAPTNISFNYDPGLIVTNDDRPGKDPVVHKLITTTVSISVLTSTLDYSISSGMKFYFVRGDSAAIPGDLGVGPDANRWYLERWEDNLVCPKTCATVGKVKLDYQTP